MIEEADVVVLLLERFDLALDEFIELIERYLNIGGNFEVHCCRLEPLVGAGCSGPVVAPGGHIQMSRFAER